jgi:hypothetical protein
VNDEVKALLENPSIEEEWDMPDFGIYIV